MLRKTYLILTYARGIFRENEFWNYAQSLNRVDDADYVLLSDDIADMYREKLEDDYDVKVVKVPEVTDPYRGRHLAFWRYLNDEGHKYKHVITTDSRDVIFQKSPFEWVDEWKTRYDSIHGNKDFLNHFVILASEGLKVAQSGFACIEHFEFQRDVPLAHQKDIAGNYVVNSGVSLGTYQALMNYHMLLWATNLKTRGRCTDQAALNYLMSYLDEEAGYCASSPVNDWFCLTCEAVKEGFVKPTFENGFLKNPQGKEYAIVHQWDRLEDSLRESMLNSLNGGFSVIL